MECREGTVDGLWLHKMVFNPLNAELSHICHLLALLGAHRILHVSKIRVKTPKYVEAGTNA